eukprot:scaffold237487_cov37-Tisochrysis_lutea.AAC.2
MNIPSQLGVLWLGMCAGVRSSARRLNRGRWNRFAVSAAHDPHRLDRSQHGSHAKNPTKVSLGGITREVRGFARAITRGH